MSAFVPTLDPTNPIPLSPTVVDNFAAADGTPVTFILDANGTYSYLYSRPFVAIRQAPSTSQGCLPQQFVCKQNFLR